MSDRLNFIQKILDERARQFDLPGREFDVVNAPNDWIAIAMSYVLDGVTRNHMKPNAEEFEKSLIKSAAVLLAALEHIENMTRRNHFSNDTE